ncbi:MAG: SulP family inorganic anion transporter [Aeromonadaceae bacterium]
MISAALLRWAPGLAILQHYRASWFWSDLRAGLSVAAVALPVSIAYASLAGVSPIAGLYSCILPLLVYALFGTSRQLIIGPDAATCAVVAAVVAPLAGGDPLRQWQLTVIMTLMTGIWCLLGSRLRLGALAEFLSKPILLGLLNGVALTIIVGQMARLLGFHYEERGLIERLLQVPNYLAQTQSLTLAVSLFTLLILLLVRRWRPLWSGPLFAMLLCGGLSYGLDFPRLGISTLGPLSSGLTELSWSAVEPQLLREMVVPSFNLALVSFVSMMLTVRTFAVKNGYEVDADQEFRALGLANIASGLSLGFAISGTMSRTAINDVNGGKSQLVSIVAALLIGLVTLFFTDALQYLPVATLGMVLVVAAMGLTDFPGLWSLYRSDRAAFWLGVTTFASVLFIGVLPGIGFAVLLGLFQFLHSVMRPTDQLLGVDDKGVVHSLGRSSHIHAIPGVLVYRFNSPLTYFNAAYFKRRVWHSLLQSNAPVRVLIVDAVASFNQQDISVMTMLAELQRELQRQGIQLWLAGRRTSLTTWLQQAGVPVGEGGIRVCSDLYSAIRHLAELEPSQSGGAKTDGASRP